MVFLFRDKSLINVFLLVILSIGVHAHLLLSPITFLANPTTGWFSYIIIHYLQQWHPAVLFFIFQGLLISLAFRLNALLDHLRMFPTSTYLPALTLVLLSGLFSPWCSITPALLSGHLVLWIFSRISDLSQDTNTKAALLNNGLLLGVAVLCYHPLILIALAFLPAMAVVKRFRINEYLIMVLGFLLPYYFILAGAFLSDNLPLFFYQLPRFSPGWPIDQLDQFKMISFSLLLLCFIFGLGYWQRFNGRLLMQTRNYWSVLFIFIIFSISLPFLMSKEGLPVLWLITIPLSAFFSSSFSVPRRLLVPNLFFWLLVALSVLHNWLFIKK